MKRVLFVTIINVLMMMNLFGQGKLPDFNFPKDVIKNSEAQLKTALEKGDGQSVVDAIVKYGIAQSSISEENFEIVIKKIEDVIKKEKKEDIKAILRCLESEIYSSHEDQVQADSVYQLAIANEELLRSHKIEEYKSIIKSDALGRRLCPTLYDFLKYQKEGSSYIYSILEEGEMQGYRLKDRYPTKSDYDDYVKYVKDYPNSPWINDIKNCITSIETQYARLNYKQQIHSKDSFKINIHSTNAKKVKLVVYSVPSSEEEKYSVKRKSLRKVKSYDVEFPHDEIFFEDEKTFTLDPLPYGLYYIDVLVNNKEPEGDIVYLYSQTFRVSDTSTFRLNESDKENYTVFTVDTKTGALIKEEQEKKKYWNKSDNNRTQQRLSILTDLGIYRPGETLHYTLICSESTIDKKSPLINHKIEINLRDTNGKDVASDTLYTDAFGQLEGSFIIPTDRTNGMFRMFAKDITEGSESASISTNISVSEYKTPTFYVDLSDNPYSFDKDKDVTIKGKCRTYSGVPLVNKEVKIDLQSSSWWFFARANDSYQVNISETVHTDSKGEFSLTINKERLTAYSHHYEVSCIVTDDAGESQDAKTSFFVGRQRGLTYNGVRDFLIDTPIKLPISFVSSDPDDKVENCAYRLIDAKDTTKVAKEGTLQLANPVLDLKNIASGKYILRAEIPDADNNVEEEIVLYHNNDKTCPIESALWIPSCGRNADKNGLVHITIGTAFESNIFYLATSRTGIISRGWIQYKPGMHEFNIQIPEGEHQHADLTFLCFYDGELYEEHFTVDYPKSQKNLKLKTTSFRDKIIPGSRESWTFSVEGENIDNLWAGRLAFRMISEAVNKLHHSNWSFYSGLLHGNGATVNGTRIYSHSISEQYSGKHLKEAEYTLPNINTYGRMFTWGYKNMVMYDLMEDNVMVGAARPLMSKAAMPNAVERLAVAEESAILVETEAEGGNANSISSDAQSSNIQMRESETKVAVWKPMVDIGTDGKVTIEFDVPLDNTTWRMNAFAFDKQMTSSNSITELIVAQRPVMVSPNLPRFLRNGDKTSLMANVLNASEEEQIADVLIELFDPRTKEVISSKTLTVTIPSGDSKAVGIECEATDSEFLGYRIKASVNGSGDGEQQMIPILPAVIPVVETIPFYLNPSDNDTIIDVTKFPADAELSYEYCNNPVWYCLDALPSIYDKDASTATGIMHSLYAIALSNGIKTTYDIKNDSIGIETNDANRDALIKKLCDLQNPDGGISWFDWNERTSSEYVTYEVLELLGEIRKLGFEIESEDLNNLEKRALVYYEKEQLKNLASIKKHTKKIDYSMFESYLYLRTLYPTSQYSLPKENASLLDKTLKDTEKNWKNFSLPRRGFVALTLARNNKMQTAKLIIESLRQFAVDDPRRGMFWDNLQTFGFRWYRRTSLTAHMLEAFNEIDSRIEEIDQIRKWILLEKQTTDWGSSSMAAEATYALLATGSEWLMNTESAEYIKEDITTREPLVINHKKGAPAWGAVYAKIPSVIKDTKAFKLDEIELTKELRKHDGTKIVDLKDILVGDKIQVMLTVTTDRDMQYVTIKDNRAACFEPVDKTSGYQFSDSNIKNRQSIGYYNDIKDSENRIMINFLPKGSHVITYDVYVTNSGTFCTGLADVTCEYAPQFTAHTAGDIIEVKE